MMKKIMCVIKNINPLKYLTRNSVLSEIMIERIARKFRTLYRTLQIRDYVKSEVYELHYDLKRVDSDIMRSLSKEVVVGFIDVNMVERQLSRSIRVESTG